jgi:hypothetical protein
MATAQHDPQLANTPAPIRRRASTVLWVSIVVMGLLIFSLPTVIVFVFGMIPSMVAYVVDRTKEKYATFCVASMNFCGVFPYLMDLWFDTHTMYAAMNILADVFALAIMLSAAASGWIIYRTVPPVIFSFLSVIAQQRVNALRSEQRKLIEEWGQKVSVQADAAAIVAATIAQPTPAFQSVTSRVATKKAEESDNTLNKNDGPPPKAAAG